MPDQTDVDRRKARDAAYFAVKLLCGQPGMSKEAQVANVAKAKDLLVAANHLLGQVLNSKMEMLSTDITAQALLESADLPDLDALLAEIQKESS